MWEGKIYFLPDELRKEHEPLKKEEMFLWWDKEKNVAGSPRRSDSGYLPFGVLITMFLRVKHGDLDDVDALLIQLGNPPIFNEDDKEVSGLHKYKIFFSQCRELQLNLRKLGNKEWLNVNINNYRANKIKITFETKSYAINKNSVDFKEKKFNTLVYTSNDIFSLIWLEVIYAAEKRISPFLCASCKSYILNAKKKTKRFCYFCTPPSRLPINERTAEEQKKKRERDRIRRQYQRGAISLEEANKYLRENHLKEIRKPKRR